MHPWLQALEALFYPGVCLLCRAAAPRTRDLCAGCATELPANPRACPRCALPLPPQADLAGAPLCGRCLKRPPPYERAIVPWRYAAPVDHLIKGLKFQGRLSHARVLGSLLAEALAPHTVRAEALVPVPLHPHRLRERGFNQSTELARPLARALGIALADDVCRRAQPTTPQAALTASARRRNVRGAFSVRAPLPAAHLAIVDDVVTTGHTVAELARTLRRAGAQRIEVWAVARALP